MLLRRASELANHVLGTHALHTARVRVRQMLSIDTKSVSGIANTISESANIHGLGNPSGRDTAEQSRQTVHVLGGGAAVGVDIAGEAGTVLWVADEEDALDCVHGGAGEAGHGVYGGGGALRVALEDEAHVGVGAKGGGDLVDNLRIRRYVSTLRNLENGDEVVGRDVRLWYQEQSSDWRRRDRRCCRRYRRGLGRGSASSWF
jgi:hypothetical protein